MPQKLANTTPPGHPVAAYRLQPVAVVTDAVWYVVWILGFLAF